MRVLVVRRDCRGDIVAATSVLPGLRRKYPGAYIAWCVNPIFRGILEGLPLDEIRHDTEGQWDLVIELKHHEDWRAPLEVIYCEQAGVELSRPTIDLTADEDAFGGFAQGAIAVACDAGWATRQYKRFQEVVDLLTARAYRLVEVDRERSLERVEWRPTTIKQAASILKHSRLYLGIDTLAMHLVLAVGIPMVVLMCATGPENQWIPEGSQALRVVEEPCTWSRRRRLICPYRHCPEKMALDLLSPEAVVEATERMLK